MLDFFVIFSKGGIVLWCCEGTKDLILTSINDLIRSVFLQERTGSGSFDHNSLLLQYKLDNEFELIYVAGYQKVLKLAYVDKFLDDIHREIRDKYKNEIKATYSLDIQSLYDEVLRNAESYQKALQSQPKVMRTFEESKKSMKTVASMIVGGKEEETKEKKPTGKENFDILEMGKSIIPKGMRKQGPGKFESKKSPKPVKEPAGKKPRQWDNGGTTKDLETLDRTKDGPATEREFVPDLSKVGKMTGQLKSIQIVEESKKESPVFNLFKGLVGGKTLTAADVAPCLEKLKDHLISKNVASEVSVKICESVSVKLEGKVLGTFQSVNSTVRSALEESLLQLLQPKRQVDVLRDALECKRQGRPFVLTFCGVNGVGKSTNLAKICFWLIENDLKVLVAACDTFRAGAVEQLRTHAKHLNALHPPKNNVPCVQLYEKGYGKDAAGVAAEAISFAKDQRLDVVLVDTAGRMQDNEPLMRALAKLIRVNDPDLVLFVGEALVGNEAVDQLVKFNRAMADFSDQANPRLIDGIVLSKFDTIDDKVGAAVSMAYITGQPIVFVGTGQTYTDLKALDSHAVVAALMK